MRGERWLALVLLFEVVCVNVTADSSWHDLAEDNFDDNNFSETESIDTSLEHKEAQGFESKATKEAPILKSHRTFPGNIWHKPLQNGRLEIGCIIGLIFVVLQAYLGKKQNERLIEKWVDATREFFNESFEACGFNCSVVRAFGWDYFEFFATGRIHCSYCLAKLQCRPRQCPWQNFIIGQLHSSKDVMDLEISLTMPRMELKALQNLNKDMESCVSLRKSPFLSPGLCVLSDNSEVMEKLITQEVADVFNAHANAINHLIISDIISSDRFADITPGNRILRLSITLPSAEHMTDILSVLQVIFSLVDSISTLNLSEQARGKVKQAREALQKRQLQETEEERREVLEKKKAEKKQEELERVKTLTPEARRKWEEKQQKKEAKMNKPKMKMIKG